MGQIFTTKYNFVFNTDKKQIGFYKNVNKTSKKENLNNYINNKNNNFLIIVIIFVAFIFTCIGLIIGRRIFGWKRKLIVNEIIEEHNYEYRTNNSYNKSYMIESNYIPIGDNNKNSIFEMTKKFND